MPPDVYRSKTRWVLKTAKDTKQAKYTEIDVSKNEITSSQDTWDYPILAVTQLSGIESLYTILSVWLVVCLAVRSKISFCL